MIQSEDKLSKLGGIIEKFADMFINGVPCPSFLLKVPQAIYYLECIYNFLKWKEFQLSLPESDRVLLLNLNYYIDNNLLYIFHSGYKGEKFKTIWITHSDGTKNVRYHDYGGVKLGDWVLDNPQSDFTSFWDFLSGHEEKFRVCSRTGFCPNSHEFIYKFGVSVDHISSPGVSKSRTLGVVNNKRSYCDEDLVPYRSEHYEIEICNYSKRNCRHRSHFNIAGIQQGFNRIAKTHNLETINHSDKFSRPCSVVKDGVILSVVCPDHNHIHQLSLPTPNY